ncbi:DNA mismatch repair protein MutS [Sphingomonas hengshuiensis]|uniref:DNA mismatch repair protein MutS n=1 Tax=Sphingomonas hengshuiensis TaxID=1609977 RepID=A0A7U5BFV9_9SPHN|nr:DNA mismatch repair protein MutS [Sphingomonas hengshuiensis]
MLAPDEAALWKRVIATVTPIRTAGAPRAVPPVPPAPLPAPAPAPAPLAKVKGRVPPPREVKPSAPKPSANTLDGSWDRRLSRGLVAPESAVDLHGHNLASAYDRLDRGLDEAVRRGDRVLLLVTGKPPRAESERPHARGAIRAAVGDWLASSRHSDRIAAVRGAHPRHGGSGALYIILRRQPDRAPRKS